MTTTIQSLSPNKAAMRFREPYVSDGLNRKMNGVTPAGVLRGGKLVTAGVGLSVVVQEDADTLDSIYSYINASGRQVTVREDSSVTLDLTPNAGTVVYVAMFVDYSTSGTTVVEWRTYTHAELFGGSPVAEAPYVVVVGRVDVPGVGPIPAGNVTPDGRRVGARELSPAMRPWIQVVENGSFDAAGDAAYINSIDWGHAAGWGRPEATTPSVFNGGSISTATARSGLTSLRVQGHSVPATAVAFRLVHARRVHVRPGQLVHAICYLSGVGAWPGCDGAGFQGLQLRFYTDPTGNTAPVSTVNVSDPSLTGAFAWTKLESLVAVPAGAYLMEIVAGAATGALTVPAATDAVHIDDVSVWVEPDALAEQDAARERGDRVTEARLDVQPSTAGGVSVVGLRDIAVRALRFFHAGFDAGIDEDTWFAGPAGWAAGLRAKLDLVATSVVVHGQATVGRAISGSAAWNDTPKLVVASPRSGIGAKVLLEESYDTGLPSDSRLRRYHDHSGTWGSADIFTVNAKYSSTTSEWTADDVTAPAYLWTSLGWLTQRSTAVPWLDAAWTAMSRDVYSSSVAGALLRDLRDARVKITSTSTDPLEGSNPPHNAASLQGNVLLAKNIPKCWGVVTSNTITDGFNIASYVGGIAGPPARSRVTFQTPMANDTYEVTAAVTGHTGAPVLYGVQVCYKTATTFDFSLIDLATATFVSTGSLPVGARIEFSVFGRQDT